MTAKADSKRMQQLAQRSRDAARRTGGGWGSGTLHLPGTPRTVAPDWMGARPPHSKGIDR